MLLLYTLTYSFCKIIQKITFEISVVTAAILVALVIALATYNMTNLVLAQGPPTTVINLTGDQEVPSVQTDSSEVAEFTQMGPDSIAYNVNATNIEGTTAGHVHFGNEGENGHMAGTLFKYDSPVNEVSDNGTITADILEGPLAGKQISDLVAAGINVLSSCCNPHT